MQEVSNLLTRHKKQHPKNKILKKKAQTTTKNTQKTPDQSTNQKNPKKNFNNNNNIINCWEPTDLKMSKTEFPEDRNSQSQTTKNICSRHTSAGKKRYT